MDTQLLPFLAVTSVVMLVPGPSVLFAVTQRLRSGPAAGAFAILGLESGFAIHVAAACLGVSGLVAANDALLRALQVGGAAYLAWLGIQLLRRGDHATVDATPASDRGLARTYLAGLLVDLLNPKTVLFFVAVLPQFVDLDAGSVPLQMMQLGLIFFLIALISDAVWALAAAGARTWFGKSPKRIEALTATGGGLMIGLGGILLLTGSDH